MPSIARLCYLHADMNKQWPFFLTAFLLPLLVVLWWWGVFSTPAVETLSREPLHYAYLVSEGDYSKVDDRHKEVDMLLKQQGISSGRQVTLIESDPRSTPARQRKARAAVIIAADAHPAAPLLEDSLPQRQALVVSARAHPFVAYGKAYGALLEYLGQNSMPLRLPVLEATHDNTLTIEMSLQ